MGYEVDTNILETYAKRLLNAPLEPTKKFFGTTETIEKDLSDVASSIKEGKSDQQLVTHVSPIVTSSETDSDKAAEFKRVDRKKRKYPMAPTPSLPPKKARTLRKKEQAMKGPSNSKKKIAQKKMAPKISDALSLAELINEITQENTIEESIILYLDIFKKVLIEVIDVLPNDLYLRHEAKRMSIIELDKKLKVKALLVVHLAKSRQEIDELIAKTNKTIFVSGHWQVYQKGDKGKNKVDNVPDLTIKDNLPPPAQDTPPVAVEAQAEVQNQPTKKTSEEQKLTDVVDPESNVLFTIKVDTQDINITMDDTSIPEIGKDHPTNTPVNIDIDKTIVDDTNKAVDKESFEEKKSESVNIEIFDSSVKALNTQHDINNDDIYIDTTKVIDDEILTNKAQEQTTSEPAKDKNENKEEEMIAPECKVDHIIGSIGKLDTFSKFISANIQSLDKINEKTVQEKVDKENEVFFRETIKECTQQIDTLLLALNSTILEYKELYWEACKPHQLIEDIDDQIRKNQKEIDDNADNTIGSSKLSSIIEQEMTTHEEKIENLEKEKERLKIKARELKNKLG
ncbi:uncharacterized protein LOC131856491 [Cryptomeria japonica]|uniref:uncharacterized protein LOC131856491 n=1 Tax=Cryptomeria japonica TaxID=3369 RepID=UPI0027DA41A7|nr:uncharacterized protein LOC131856491 [Cryptomeria japonica]